MCVYKLKGLGDKIKIPHEGRGGYYKQYEEGKQSYSTVCRLAMQLNRMFDETTRDDSKK